MYNDYKISFTFIQINILNDISSSLNFNYKINAPSDGDLWGDILPNGSATGLVGDVKVSIE